jgi:hypothetical protein
MPGKTFKSTELSALRDAADTVLDHLHILNKNLDSAEYDALVTLLNIIISHEHRNYKQLHITTAQ